MTHTPAEVRPFEPRGRDWNFFAVLGCAAMLVSGCAAQKKQAIPWTTAVLVRPILPDAVAGAEETEEIPDIQLEIAPVEPVFVPPSGPVRPRVAPPPAPRETPAAKTEAPQIVPELSAQESSTLRRETEQSLNDAERNVTVASQRTLSAAQADLASKVRGFIADAREAGRVGDWPRARDLAKKAEVLSQELTGSL